jgi:hypothetical protein
MFLRAAPLILCLRAMPIFQAEEYSRWRHCPSQQNYSVLATMCFNCFGKQLDFVCVNLFKQILLVISQRLGAGRNGKHHIH